MTKLAKLLLLVSLFQWTAASSSNFHRLMRQEAPSHACLVEDLAEDCPDSSVDQDKLVEECQEGTHGIKAAHCYMVYLCENHDQETVNEHKLCIDEECPLAKHLPPMDCSQYESNKPEEPKEEPEEEPAEENTEDNEDNTENTEDNEDTELQVPECTALGMVTACDDGKVDRVNLLGNCDGLIDEQAANCYMSHLCKYHDQDTVMDHYDCIDSMCPDTQMINCDKPEETLGCTALGLVDMCHDQTKERLNLLGNCDGLEGIPAAVCYMSHLCTYENQDVVIEHKKCIDEMCPATPIANCDNPGVSLEGEEFSKMTYAPLAATQAPASEGGGGGLFHFIWIALVTTVVAGTLFVFRWQILAVALVGLDTVTGQRRRHTSQPTHDADWELPTLGNME